MMNNFAVYIFIFGCKLIICDLICVFVTECSNVYVALFKTFGMQKDDNILLEVFSEQGDMQKAFPTPFRRKV